MIRTASAPHRLRLVVSATVCLCLGLLLLSATVGGPSGTALEVGPPGSGKPYTSIQAAIDGASGGDVVVVYPGTYYERINFNGKPITVRSTDPEDPAVVGGTIIDGQQGGSVVTFNVGETRSAMLLGFTLTGGRSDCGGGIKCINLSSPTNSNVSSDRDDVTVGKRDAGVIPGQTLKGAW